MNNIDTYKFYRSSKWLNKRQEVLDRDNFECQMCKEEGGVGKGVVVHHVEHLKDREDLALKDENLLTLCLLHHNVVHPEKFNNSKEDRVVTEERW